MKKVIWLLILPTLWSGTHSVTAAEQRVRIAYISRSISSALLFIAQDKGFFHEEGLAPEIILTRATTAIAAQLAGEVEGIHIIGAAIRANQRGAPLKILTVNQKLPLFWLVTRPELKTFKSLRGKIMGVTTLGGNQQLAGFYMLQKGGLDPHKDITSVVSGDVPAQLQAMVAGVIQIGVLSPPAVVVARDRYKMNLLATTSDEFVQFISGLSASQKTLVENPALIKHMVRALAKANRYFHENEQGTAGVLAKYLSVDYTTALETYRFSRPGFTADGIPTDREIQEELKGDAEILQLKSPVKPSSVFDFSVQREVNQELNLR